MIVQVIIEYNNWIEAIGSDFHLTDVGKKSLTPPSGKRTVMEQQSNHDLKKTDDNSSHEEGELLLKNDKLQNNGHGTEAKSNRTANQHPYSDNSSKSRFFSLISSFLSECLDVVLLFVFHMQS